MKTKMTSFVACSAIAITFTLFGCKGIANNADMSKDTLSVDTTKIISAIPNAEMDSLYTLAKEGNIDACGKLARYYVHSAATTENHCHAYYWANRASEEDRTYVMDILEKYGFLIDGEPITKCDDIMYK